MRSNFRFLAVLLVIITLFSFVGCESAPIRSTEQAKKSVGKVGDFDIPYEEFYFLVHTYASQIKAEHGDDALTDPARVSELRELVYENIVTSYSVLTLAAEQGITLDSDEIKEEIQTKLDLYIAQNFDGSRSDYKDSMKDIGTTDSYVRFSLGVDIIYSRLVTKYLELGIVSDDDDYVKEHINNNFVRTIHVMIINDDGGTESRARAEEVLAKFESGATMYEMIKNYSQDFMMTTEDGYYFTRGIMDQRYEDAAYSLDVGERSGIVTSLGRDASGNQVECYYIIKRLELEEDYVNKNFKTLKEYYYTSAIYEMVEDVEASLKFVPNDYCESLDLTSLEEPKTLDFVVINIWVLVGGIVLIVIMLAVGFTVKIKRKNADILGKKPTLRSKK